MLVLLVLFAWLGACRGDAVEEIARRLARLRAVASSAPRHKPCNASRLVVITEYPWGNAGNQLISFTHGLYMAQLTDATLVVPHYMSAAVLHPFNLTLIRSLYCFKEEWDYEGACVCFVGSASTLGSRRVSHRPPHPSPPNLTQPNPDRPQDCTVCPRARFIVYARVAAAAQVPQKGVCLPGW